MNMRCYVDMLLITSTANIKTWERDNGLYGGLSPLARGTRALPEWGLFCTRFIPAGAGNTWSREQSPRHCAVYPRWRGELMLIIYINRELTGLSPLARGTPTIFPPFMMKWRFIPAGAGNSVKRQSGGPTGSVYPRWRGELSDLQPVFRTGDGLSPLARGTHIRMDLWNGFTRFIPAGAGNSAIAEIKCGEESVYPRWRGELSKHNLLLINDFLSQSQSTNFTVSHKQHIHYVKERLIHWLKR